MIDPGDVLDEADSWVSAGDVAATLMWDVANRAKDKSDEALDAMRVHNGMTLDEFLAQQ